MVFNKPPWQITLDEGWEIRFRDKIIVCIKPFKVC